jgi:hypothetical protein
VSYAGSLAGGFAGTLVLASALQAATALRLTRIDLPFLLGSVFTREHGSAKAVGYALQATIGVSFALVYHALSPPRARVPGRSGSRSACSMAP